MVGVRMGAMSAARIPWMTLVRAPNPGPMTLEGTNTWVLRGAGSDGCVIVDPGPDDDGHLAALAKHAPVEAIIVTHRHLDHLAGVERLVELLGGGVPVAAAVPELCRDAEPLRDRERRFLAGLSIEVLATPGHTRDSVCLLVDGGDDRAIFTGDTILGRGTTVVAWPDGNLGDYLASLDRLSALDGIPVHPGHGPDLADCGKAAREYRAHREDRLNQVRTALAAGARTPADVVAAVYPDLDPVLIPAAEWTVRAALAYLGPP
jgi:glyoxylase-like metal-dependent hydrolase (beta-lactamase superfamily II)